MIQNCIPHNPFWPCDAELERLRRLEREAIVADEKQQIRERLRRRGINPDAPCFPPFMPWAPCVPVQPWAPVMPSVTGPYNPPAQPITIGDVLKKLG